MLAIRHDWQSQIKDNGRLARFGIRVVHNPRLVPIWEQDHPGLVGMFRNTSSTELEFSLDLESPAAGCTAR